MSAWTPWSRTGRISRLRKRCCRSTAGCGSTTRPSSWRGGGTDPLGDPRGGVDGHGSGPQVEVVGVVGRLAQDRRLLALAQDLDGEPRAWLRELGPGVADRETPLPAVPVVA